MAYVRAGLIEAVDFNTLRSQLLQVYGVGFGDFGYGQSSITIPTVSGGHVDTIKSAEWNALRNVSIVCQAHQNTVIHYPPATSLEVGDVVRAYDGITTTGNIPGAMNALANRRLFADSTATSLFTSRSVQNISNAWVSSASTVLDLTFTSSDAARYFFNSGGQIRVRASRSSGSVSPQNTAWTNLLSGIGSVIINYTNTTKTGTIGVGTNFGYYDLPNVDPKLALFTAHPAASYYSSNMFSINAEALGPHGANGGNGNVVRIEVLMNDLYTGGTDHVDGTLSVALDELRATTYLTVPSFTVSIVTPLSAS